MSSFSSFSFNVGFQPTCPDMRIRLMIDESLGAEKILYIKQRFTASKNLSEDEELSDEENL